MGFIADMQDWFNVIEPVCFLLFVVDKGKAFNKI
jgi:hypothetical protein